MNKIFFFLFLIVLGTVNVIAQQGLITGTVVDETGALMPGVNVTIAGKTIGTITNNDGKFALDGVSIGDFIVFSFIGMETQRIEVTNLGQVINVTLFNSTVGLDELVVVGYGEQKKESVVGAIGVAQGEELRSSGNVSNLRDALTGVIPGMSVLASSGLPSGGDSRIHRETEILIRGKNTWNSSAPLILVDGIEREMDDIDINEVASISVLKDASATAVFGVKGGNGVILITTKRGKEGKAQFTVEGEYSLETWNKIVEPAGLVDAIDAFNYAVERTRRIDGSSGLNYYYSDEVTGYYRDNTYPYAYPNTDWLDLIFKDFAQSYRLNGSVRGGTDRLKYFANAGYNHVGDLFNGQDIGRGYQPGYSYDRINIRSNFDVKLTALTNLRVNFYGIQTFQNSLPGYRVNSVFDAISAYPPNAMVPIYEDGVYGARNYDLNAYNPYYELNTSGIQAENNTTINMDYTLEQDLKFITEGLKFSAKVAYDNRFEAYGLEVRDDGVLTKTVDEDFYLNGGYYDQQAGIYRLADGDTANMSFPTTVWDVGGGGAVGAGFGWIEQPTSFSAPESRANRNRRNLYYEARLNYGRTFGAHDVTGTALFSRQEEVRGSNWPGKREDWVGRVTYNYDRRYFLEVNGAYNGSEKFGPGYRFELFPSIGGSWMITNEPFMQDASMDWLERLKIRYSWGLVGNDRVNAGGQWPYYTVWELFSNAIPDIGNDRPTDIEESRFGYPFSDYDGYIRTSEGTPGNPDLRWETARKQNLGFDIGFINNRISMSVDLWDEYRYDMLIAANQRNVPFISGVPAFAAANLGEAKSRGMEFEVTFRNSISNVFNYWAKANWSVARSEIIFKEDPPLTPSYRAQAGFPLNQTRTSMASGIIESWDDIYTTPGSSTGGQNEQRMPGDVALIDFDADGLYESADDVVPYGYPVYPQNNYGISLGADYKGLEFSIQFVGAYNVTRNISDSKFNYERAFIPNYLLERSWTYNSIDANYPALSRGSKWDPTGHYQRYDGSFFRIQAAQVAYSLPDDWSNKIGIARIQFYVNGRNLWMWSIMPDDGVGANHDLKNYPTKKQVNFGLRVQF
ncbi:MAG: SusC/RagA family TonB-linked outer membrane protein [Bacteroidales bacterium]